MIALHKAQAIASLIQTARDAEDQGYPDLADDIVSLVRAELGELSSDDLEDENEDWFPG